MALRMGKTRSVAEGLMTPSLLGAADAELLGGKAKPVAFVAGSGVDGSSGTGDTVEKLKRPSSRRALGVSWGD
jgi:hypothetical protein